MMSANLHLRNYEVTKEETCRVESVDGSAGVYHRVKFGPAGNEVCVFVSPEQLTWIRDALSCQRLSADSVREQIRTLVAELGHHWIGQAITALCDHNDWPTTIQSECVQ